MTNPTNRAIATGRRWTLRTSRPARRQRRSTDNPAATSNAPISTRPTRAASALLPWNPIRPAGDDDDPERPDGSDQDLRAMGLAGRRQVVPVAAAVGEGSDRGDRRGRERGGPRAGRPEQGQQDRCRRRGRTVGAVRETDRRGPGRALVPGRDAGQGEREDDAGAGHVDEPAERRRPGRPRGTGRRDRSPPGRRARASSRASGRPHRRARRRPGARPRRRSTPASGAPRSPAARGRPTGSMPGPARRPAGRARPRAGRGELAMRVVSAPGSRSRSVRKVGIGGRRTCGC